MTQFDSVQLTPGNEIFDNGGDLVGWASELLVCPDEGRVAYVRLVLARGQSATRRTVVVPWSIITCTNKGETQWRVEVRKSILDSIADRQS